MRHSLDSDSSREASTLPTLQHNIIGQLLQRYTNILQYNVSLLRHMLIPKQYKSNTQVTPRSYPYGSDSIILIEYKYSIALLPYIS